MTINERIRQLEQLDIHQTAQLSLYDTREQYLDQQQDQMFAGKLASGRDIEPPYALSTKGYKTRKGQPIDRVTLRDTQEFYKSMGVDVRPQVLYVHSAVRYEQDLIKKYSELIYGLGGVWKITYVGELRIAFINQVKNQLR